MAVSGGWCIALSSLLVVMAGLLLAGMMLAGVMNYYTQFTRHCHGWKLRGPYHPFRAPLMAVSGGWCIAFSG